MWNSDQPIQICKFCDYSQTIKSNEIIKINKFLTPNENKLKKTVISIQGENILETLI